MSDLNKLRLVVADDNEMNLMILIKSTEIGGHSTIGFEEGDITWEYLESHPNDVDVVLLDIMMHTMSGLEIMERMKNHPILQHIPVILQSGIASPDKVEEALAAGAKGYLVKPYNQKQLLAMITKVAMESGLKEHN